MGISTIDFPLNNAVLEFVTNADVGGGLKQTSRSSYASVVAAMQAAITGSTWGNTELALSGSYTVQAGDAGKTLNLSSNVGTITFGAVAGYAATFAVRIANTTARAWPIAANGQPTILLWPEQAMWVFRVGARWFLDHAPVWVTKTSPIIYVNHATGSSSNDGLTSGSPLPTIQSAFELFEKYIDTWQLGATIQVANGSFTESSSVHTKRLRGYHVIVVRGDPTTPGNCVWNVPTGLVGVTCRDWSGIILDGFRFQSPGSSAIGCSASQHGIIDIANVEWGTMAGGIHCQSTNGGSVGYVAGTISKVIGNAALHWDVSAGANLLVTGVTIEVPSPLTMTAWLSMTGGSAITSGVTFTNGSGGAAATVTGSKYSVAMNGVYLRGGVTLPGTVAGSTSTGGQAA